MVARQFPGRLIVFEGVDGAGKSTQVALLEDWLTDQGYLVVCLAWRSPAAVVDLDGRTRKEAEGNNAAFALLYAADMAMKTHDLIVPALQAGYLVICDRYIYTAFARDVARGVDRQWIRQVYHFALTPDLALYCRIPLDLALARILADRGRIGFYEAGMDMQLAASKRKSFGRFQQRILDEYERMVDEFGLVVIDAARNVEGVQRQIQRSVQALLPALAAT